VNPELGLLARLRDVHPPDSPSWWPPAPGWWIAAALAIVLGVLAWRFGPAAWRRWRLRRRLLAALEDSSSAAEISQVLRRAAILRFPAPECAGLQGAAWLEFLERAAKTRGRFEALGDALTAAPYRAPRPDEDVGPLRTAARGWLREVL
jgi:Domain of unknown function (DUF4381)